MSNYHVIIYIYVVYIVNLPFLCWGHQVKVEDFPRLAENAMKDACGATTPHQPNKEEVIQLFQDAYDQDMGHYR